MSDVGEPKATYREASEPEADSDYLTCASCGKEHDRFFRTNGIALTWQVVVFNARSEFLSDNSEHATVCREGECANKWFMDNAPVVAGTMTDLYFSKMGAEDRNRKIAAGRDAHRIPGRSFWQRIRRAFR